MTVPLENSEPASVDLTQEDQRIATHLLHGLQQYWGYSAFRPLQREAMTLVMKDHDSLVVLPTGGGKSLCYQVPAVSRDGLAIVVSPLISLMKDQVDSLIEAGVPAGCINSMQSGREKADIASRIRNRELRLLYIAPERLVQERTLEFLQDVQVSFVAIDEAHCISQWGHDFRPEYRKLSCLREVFPNTSIHGYTATATPQVRSDIVEQLKLRVPEVLVGSFDRPNLSYRVEHRSDPIGQIDTILRRHAGESGIIYCISRKNVEETSTRLNTLGYSSRPYHAGMNDDDRRRNQDAFIEEKVQIIVATVAFGMGIDKSNVRFVIHAGMPRSLENYQQEAGRAGRDGLEAECTLLYSGADVELWEFLMRETEDPELLQVFRSSLRSMQRYCVNLSCRHKQLVEHFGQTLECDNCGACDICLDELQPVAEPLIVGQKVASSVVRQGQRYGAAYTAQVLKGKSLERIRENKHHELSTFGLLRDESEQQIRSWIDQLLSQGFLKKVGEYNCIEVTERGWKMLRGEEKPHLLMVRPARRRSKKEDDHWDGVNRDLFEELRILRLRLAGQKSVPPYIVFSDATLRDLARQRPASLQHLNGVYGIGASKVKEYGDVLISTIGKWCVDNNVPVNVVRRGGPGLPSGATVNTAAPSPKSVSPVPAETRISLAASECHVLFDQQLSLEEIAERSARAVSTVVGYLQDYLKLKRRTDIDAWVPPAARSRIEDAIFRLGIQKLKPIFEDLGGSVSYEQIKIVATVIEILSEDADRAQS